MKKIFNALRVRMAERKMLSYIRKHEENLLVFYFSQGTCFWGDEAERHQVLSTYLSRGTCFGVDEANRPQVLALYFA